MRASLAVFMGFALVACSGAQQQPPSGAASPARSATAAPAPVTPVPETLALVAGQFGLTMQAEGFTWKVLRRNVTRFDWSGRSTSGDRELLYSFWIEKLDAGAPKLLPHMVASAAANLTEGEPCAPIEQPPELVKALGVDRVVSVCFEPSVFYARDFKQGVLHGILHKGSLTLVAVLSNDRKGVVPLPAMLGARGAP